MVADQRVHGITHERPIGRFAREALTPLGARAQYRYERERVRRLPADALVAIGAVRYSAPVQYVGRTVTVQKTATHYTLYEGRACIARHAKAPRHAVVMERTHYHGLFRAGDPAPRLPVHPSGNPRISSAPGGGSWVRDLARYATLVEGEGAA